MKKKNRLLIISLFTITVTGQQLKGQSSHDQKVCELYKTGIKEHFIDPMLKVTFKCDSSFTLYSYSNEVKKNKNSSSNITVIDRVSRYKILDLDSCKIVPYGVSKSYRRKGVLSILSYRSLDGRLVQQFFNFDGDLAEINFYNQSKLDGLHSSFYNNQNIKEVGIYNDGFKSGMWSYYYPNGSLKASGAYTESYHFLNFVDPTSYEVMDESGEVVKTVEHNLSYNQLIDSLAKALPDLNIRDTILGIIQIGDVYDYERDGLWRYYNKEGELIKKEFYDHGTLLRTEE